MVVVASSSINITAIKRVPSDNAWTFCRNCERLWTFMRIMWIYDNKRKTSKTWKAVKLKSLWLIVFPDYQHCLISELCHFLQLLPFLGAKPWISWKICRLQWSQRQQLDNTLASAAKPDGGSPVLPMHTCMVQ